VRQILTPRVPPATATTASGFAVWNTALVGNFCVTGANSGIGWAVASALSASGHVVVGVDLTDGEASQVCDSVVVGDLADRAERSRIVSSVNAAVGGVLHGVVPCAGVGGLADPALTVSLNFFSVVDLVEALRPALVSGGAQGGSSVVLVSSFTASTTPGLTRTDVETLCGGASAQLGDEESARVRFASAGWMAYPATKLALVWWMRRRAATWMAEGVRLNAVAPGVVDTNMTRPLLDIDGVREALEGIELPAGRWATPAEVASVITFLTSPAASYVAGQVVYVDGGSDALANPEWPPAAAP